MKEGSFHPSPSRALSTQVPFFFDEGFIQLRPRESHARSGLQLQQFPRKTITKQQWKRERQVSERWDPSWVPLIVVNLHFLQVLCRSNTKKWKGLFTLIKIPWNTCLNVYTSFRNFTTCATKRRHSPFCPCTNDFGCCIGKSVIFLAFVKISIYIVVIRLCCTWAICMLSLLGVTALFLYNEM